VRKKREGGSVGSQGGTTVRFSKGAGASHGEVGQRSLRKGNPNSDPKGDPNPNPNPTGGVFSENGVFLLG
jgi:hypothetical protein